VAAPPETRQLYLLRQLQSIASWVGGVVEWTLLEAIRRLRAGHPVDLATLQEWARQRLRAGWRESRRNVASPKPKLFRLFEHYYAKIDPAVVPEEHAPRARDRVRRCLEHAWNSGILTEIASVPEDAWLRLPAPIPPESPHRPLPDTLVLDQVRIWVGLDLAYRDGDLLRIRDWKTGHAYRGDRAQMDCYALYALAKWPHTRLHQVRTMLAGEGERLLSSLGDDDLVPLAPQDEANQFQNLRVIVHQQDPNHTSPIPTGHEEPVQGPAPSAPCFKR